MKKIQYTDAEDLDLPKYVIQSLTDKSELAHIRHLDQKTYIILNYPSSPTQMQPICIETDGHETTVYAHETIDFETDISTYSFTDLVLKTLNNFEILVSFVNAKLNHFEGMIDKGINKDTIQQLFGINRQLIHYQTVINAIGDVMTYISQEKPQQLWSQDNAPEFTNIRIAINQLDQNIEMYQQIIDSIVSVSDSLFSSRLNIIMKRLTSITLVISIPTLITGFFGMNVNFPFLDHPLSLSIIMVGSTILTLLLVIYFYSKDLF